MKKILKISVEAKAPIKEEDFDSFSDESRKLFLIQMENSIRNDFKSNMDSDATINVKVEIIEEETKIKPYYIKSDM